ncbi:MAG TPA: hypothetical protein VF787_07020 [Thermoanaerobaculia bacterium]
MAQFYRWVSHDLVLSLGIESSSRYKGRFTGSFYLSRSFTWAYLPSWFPRDAYGRVGHFLRPDERELLLPSEFRRPGVVDAWWWAEEDDINKFAQAVRLGGPRFVETPGLVEKISSNEGIQRHVALLDAVADRAGAAVVAPDVPTNWLDAARDVLSKSVGPSPKATLVQLIATDAWRRRLASGHSVEASSS